MTGQPKSLVCHYFSNCKVMCTAARQLLLFYYDISNYFMLCLAGQISVAYFIMPRRLMSIFVLAEWSIAKLIFLIERCILCYISFIVQRKCILTSSALFEYIF